MRKLIKSFAVSFIMLYICFTIAIGDWNMFNYSEGERTLFAVFLFIISLIGWLGLYIQGEDD